MSTRTRSPALAALSPSVKVLQTDFANLLHRRRIVFGEMAGQRLGDSRSLDELDQADLRRFVAIFGAVFNCVITQGPACRTVIG
jgi:hypothetical protein